MQFKFKVLIKSNLTAMLLLILMVVLCYFSAKNFLLSNQKNMSEESFNQCCQMSDSFKVLIENIIYSTVTQPDFAEIIENTEFQSLIIDKLEAIRAMNLNIVGVHLYTYGNDISYNSGRFSSFYSLGDYTAIDNYREFLDSEAKSAWLYNNVDGDKLIFVSKIKSEGRDIGFVQTDVMLDTFLGFFDVDNNRSGSDTFAYYSAGDELIHRGNADEHEGLTRDILEMITFNKSGETTSDGSGFLFCQRFIPDNLYIVKLESLDAFYRNMDMLKIIFAVVALLILAVINVLYYRLIGRMTESLRSLREKIRSYHY